MRSVIPASVWATAVGIPWDKHLSEEEAKVYADALILSVRLALAESKAQQQESQRREAWATGWDALALVRSDAALLVGVADD